MPKIKITTKSCIDDFKKVHGNRYNYSEFVYTNYNTASTIICDIHGPFYTTRRSHLNSGCKKCWYDYQRLPWSEVLRRFKSAHGERYDYTKFEYTNYNKASTIICDIHGPFSQRADQHIGGAGCPTCAKLSGYGVLTREQRLKIPNVWLYHIELKSDEELFHKLGCTKNPKTRFPNIESSGYTITKFAAKRYPNAEIAYSKERKLLTHIQHHRGLKYEPKIKFGGWQECFTPIYTKFLMK